MTRAEKVRRLGVILLALVSLQPVACKEGDPLSDVTISATPSFFADEVPPGVTERYVSLRVGTIEGDRITLDVVVTSVNEPVAGIAMKLSYPPTFSRFVECFDGSLFPPGECLHAEPSSGEVIVGRSVTGSAQATPVSGSQVVVRLQFLVFGASGCPGDDACRIRIEGQNLSGGDASALLDVDGEPIVVTWVSGVLTAR